MPSVKGGPAVGAGCCGARLWNGGSKGLQLLHAGGSGCNALAGSSSQGTRLHRRTLQGLWLAGKDGWRGISITHPQQIHIVCAGDVCGCACGALQMLSWRCQLDRAAGDCACASRALQTDMQKKYAMLVGNTLKILKHTWIDA